jgi:glycosyltransferase involved in cell wall biosynthesis
MTTKPHILIFSTAYHPYIGGAEVAVREITDRLFDYEFHMITARFSRKLPRVEKVGVVSVYRIGVGIPLIDKLLLPSLGAFKALLLKRKHNFKAYWCIMVTYASLAALKANFLSSKKVPIILSLQEGDSEEYFEKKWGGLIETCWKLLLKKATYLTAISNYLKEKARSMRYHGDVSIVPNGVDVKKFSHPISLDERKRIRAEFDLAEHDTALITVSRLTSKNGIEDVIKALPLMPRSVKFLIFGKGELREPLRLLAKERGVTDRVSFRGFVTHKELPKALQASDIFIRTSLSEGFGNSFVEAMAARIPVIATPVGGIVDFLKNEETGLFAEVHNEKSIATAVMRFVHDENLKMHVVESAFKMVEQKYDWDIIAEQMNDIFTRI